MLLLLPGFMVSGQQKDLTDSTEYRFGLPISNDDTTGTVRADEDPANAWILLQPNQLPKALVHTLRKNDLYKGWERSRLYYDKKIDTYLVRMKDGSSVRTYGFNKNGRPVSFSDERDQD